MDFSNQNSPQQYNPFININDNNPLQFTIRLPPSNPNPNFASTSTQIPSVHFSNSDSISNSDPNNSVPNHFFSLSIPRKRRRGRPRNTTPSVNQVYNLPTSSLLNVSNFHYSSNGDTSSATLGNQNLGTSDVSDEIIVINKEATAEALIALTAGFPADSLTDEEIDAGVVSVVGGIEQVNYILVRNHIITKWREDVSRWVSKEMFLDIIPDHCKRLLDTSYDYLVSHGYINFGVAPAVKERIPAEPSKPSVIVIGAGLAGLAAAKQLLSFGFKVTVLEGRKRAGGRVYTKKMEGGNRTAAADLGGSVLTGTLGNPLGILARQLSYTLHKIRDKCPLYRVDGKPVDADLDQKVEMAFNRLLDKASKLRQLMGEVSQDVSLGAALETFRQVYGDAVTEEELSLFNWHLANLEYANAGLLSMLSLAFWDQDDPYDMGGDHCFLPGGTGKLVQAMVENVPILYEKTVNTIRYGSEGVQVVAGGHVYEGDMALCTVPLGVLKNSSIKFIPELPQRKLDSIKRLGFGLLNKVAMLFPHVFWGTDLDTFGHLTDDSSNRGEFFLFYSYATVAGGALLIALVAGEAAHKFETMPPTDAVTKVLQILKGIYEPQGVEVPEPIQTVCTRWGADPFSLGSYSNVAVGASGDDYDILAESVGDGRLFFAGEATNRRYPATMHGALLSGFREAANISHSVSVRALRSKVEKDPPKDAHSCASLLADLFREPDLEFGSFSVIFGRNKSDFKSTAILRVTFSPPGKRSHEGLRPDQPHTNKLLFQQLQSHFNQQQELHVYTLLSRQQALELRELRGGDEMRLHHLCEKFGVKLVGRKGLGPYADSIIASIKAERGNRKPASTSLTLKPGTSKLKAASLKQRMVRKAKILSKNNGAGPLNTFDRAKAADSSNSSNNPANHDVGYKSVGTGNGSITQNLGNTASVSSNCVSSASVPSTLIEVKVEDSSSLTFPYVEGSASVTFPPDANMVSRSVGYMESDLPPISNIGGTILNNDGAFIHASNSDVGSIFVESITGSSTLSLDAGENLVTDFSSTALENIYENNIFGFAPPPSTNSGSW